ncbi:CamS family sex pheromone protein [Cytobacillus horneckiae]|uniref:CamS family sex pheromone protein n=1 Tax=Cytobacillus horneckiae TaxID=549687 RepID=A0A2N0ZEC6_9BACI|nr:CamS family sex pheromone protein [Cytobacillus horneckiae]NRG45627.1 CamS family sex pheromone protein [Bacillus sp. CRN 9]MCM3176285.1 CamS family sex pheromone protein [Cytobacillus horneckiae]MEC1159054.1 CamS family sex pheromone protein [Cytobacillus horneckiae]MED2936802.1 CamS family sex pheromone protein [Cytobacillus horneckiae]PKG27860.1 CamS family sex pheromone protein [Cytobacillus horneckiae]
MKKIMMILFALTLLLAGCAPNFNKQEEVIEENENADEQAIIPNYNISDSYYRTILPFKPSEARGLVVNNINTKYDLTEFETGLMRVAQNNFDTEKFFFQEGQHLDRDTIRSWLNREYTAGQLKKHKLEENENLGLNPIDDEKGDIEERNEKAPIYLAHILEHNYLVKDGDEKVKLGGVVIGLAMNSVHYYQKEQYGATFETPIGHKKIEEEGKKMAEEILTRLRGMEGLENVPITIALFEQQSRTSVVPGNFFAYAHAGEGSNKLGGWEKVDEKYVLFPSGEAEKNHREDLTSFLNFKQDVEKYFPNFNGVIGNGFYIGDQLNQLNIEIPIQFYGKAEAVGFTQYVTSRIMNMFPEYISVQVNITSVNGPEALIVRESNASEPFVHIYQ